MMQGEMFVFLCVVLLFGDVRAFAPATAGLWLCVTVGNRFSA